MDAVAYKGYLIEAHSLELQEGGWEPYATLSFDSKDAVTTTPLSAPNFKYETRGEADTHAIEMAKRWIDRNG